MHWVSPYYDSSVIWIYYFIKTSHFLFSFFSSVDCQLFSRHFLIILLPENLNGAVKFCRWRLFFHCCCIYLVILLFYTETNKLEWLQVISCWQRDVLFCLHDSGSVSAHFRRRLLPVATSPETDKENTWHSGMWIC